MDKLEIHLGLTGDSPVYHTYTTIPGNYAGQIVAGPIKLIELLELHLGLSGLFPSQIERVLLLKERINELREGSFPFSSSYKKDPLGVAKRLLKLWDSWRMSGWTPEEMDELPKRMQQLLALKSMFNSVGLGIVERIIHVITVLDKRSLPSMSIHLVDPVEFYPYLYQQLLKTLFHHTEIIYESFSPHASPGTDLGKLQSLLNGQRVEGLLKNDHTLQLLSFPNDILAANAIFSTQQVNKWNPVLINADNSLLNGLHLSNNRPVCRWQTISGNGQVSQLFFLATALFKRPVNTSQVLAFLSSPVTPFSKRLARNLLKVFGEKPGFGNEGWNRSINEYLESVKGKDRERMKKKLVNFWLQNNRYLENPEFDTSLVTDIYTTLETWASQSSHLPYYKLYKEQLQNLSSLSTQLIKALKEEGETIALAKFERLQSELFSDVPALIAEAQVGCADAVTQPGAIWSEAKEILWMNAVRFEAVDYLSKYWYQEEKDFFKNQNLPVHDESHVNKIYNDGLKRMVLCAKERLVIAVPAKINGAVAARPFCLDEWDQLISLQTITIHANHLLENIPWQDDEKLTTNYPTILLPTAQKFLRITGGDFVRTCESYSSLENLFQHPAKWYIEYKLNLRYNIGVSLPAVSSLKGTIADSVMQELFKESNRNSAWWNDNNSFSDEIKKNFKRILVTEGLPFLEKKTKRLLHEYERTLSNSLCNLRTIIDSNKFIIEGTQCKVAGTIGNTPFKGYVDLLLSKEGIYYVIDLKWANSSNKYRDFLKEGTDLQLALYQTMMNKADKAGYFMLNDGKMYMRNEGANNTLQLVNYVEPNDGISTDNVYEKAANSLQYRRQELKDGKAETAYHLPVDEIDYYNDIAVDNKNLFPLKVNKNDKCKQAPYDNDLDLFFGNIS